MTDKIERRLALEEKAKKAKEAVRQNKRTGRDRMRRIAFFWRVRATGS
jgi:hypothetical protein